MNALQLALDSGRELDQITLRNGNYYMNVLDVIDHGETFEVKYRFHQTLVWAFIAKDEIASVTVKRPSRRDS